ncbi:hypothetical protein T440DRAFT_278439 [Plenodomus tracheiphilus IPT5]|uniref:Uncharacterized protein n=1 Tax=Plenodomus tracheiphilus IPT5 TaxID=1408161 RepID=A0A6A7AQI0_9PLEO|nr:hypothetical protein T440DRAFT_278439 [Plenodomus tracheiphilus IPT5]
MTIKRKRSEDDSPLSISSFGGLSTPETQSPSFFSRYEGAMEMDTDSASRSNPWNFANASRVKSSDWGYRTRKRFRDNRPDEQSIHENTLNKLFAAQQSTPLATPIPTSTISAQPIRPILQQKSTLHSFWKQLPAPPVRPLIFPIQPRQPQSPSQLPQCDDCDAPLVSDSECMDVDMDVDMGGAVESSPFACCDCGRNVCGTCAVVSARRVCLGCATSGGKASRWW